MQQRIEQQHNHEQIKNKYQQITFTQHQLYNQHASSQLYYYINLINQLVLEKCTNCDIIFCDIQCFVDVDQFLRRLYKIQQHPKKMQTLTSYYNYHKDNPRIASNIHISDIYEKWYIKQRDILYKKLKIIYNNNYSTSNSSQLTIQQENHGCLPISHFLINISEYNPQSSKYCLGGRKEDWKDWNEANQSNNIYLNFNLQISRMLTKINSISTLTETNQQQSISIVNELKWDKIVKKKQNKNNFKNTYKNTYKKLQKNKIKSFKVKQIQSKQIGQIKSTLKVKQKNNRKQPSFKKNNIRKQQEGNINLTKKKEKNNQNIFAVQSKTTKKEQKQKSQKKKEEDIERQKSKKHASEYKISNFHIDNIRNNVNYLKPLPSNHPPQPKLTSILKLSQQNPNPHPSSHLLSFKTNINKYSISKPTPSKQKHYVHINMNQNQLKKKSINNNNNNSNSHNINENKLNNNQLKQLKKNLQHDLNNIKRNILSSYKSLSKLQHNHIIQSQDHNIVAKSCKKIFSIKLPLNHQSTQPQYLVSQRLIDSTYKKLYGQKFKLRNNAEQFNDNKIMDHMNINLYRAHGSVKLQPAKSISIQNNKNQGHSKCKIKIKAKKNSWKIHEIGQAKGN